MLTGNPSPYRLNMANHEHTRAHTQTPHYESPASPTKSSPIRLFLKVAIKNRVNIKTSPGTLKISQPSCASSRRCCHLVPFGYKVPSRPHTVLPLAGRWPHLDWDSFITQSKFYVVHQVRAVALYAGPKQNAISPLDQLTNRGTRLLDHVTKIRVTRTNRLKAEVNVRMEPPAALFIEISSKT